MSKKFKIKPNRSLRENAGMIFPHMVEQMMSYKNNVVFHPEARDEMHDMRIAGRPLRYIMEAFEPAFGNAFKKYLNRVKKLLDVAGQVHDSDVMIDMLQNYLNEVKSQQAEHRGQDHTRSIQKTMALIEAETAARKKKFNELCELLTKWNERKFKKKLLTT